MPGRFRFRVPFGVQVGAVAVLFIAAVLALWTTGASVVARERRRASVKTLLERAGDELAARGLEGLNAAKRFPFFPDDQERDALDLRLFGASTATLSRYEGVEGGYFVVGYKSFLGSTGPAGRKIPVRETGGGGDSLPPLEADLIEIQVDAAIRKRQVLFAVEEVEGTRPTTVAIRSAPVTVDGEVVGATWVMIRLVDPVFLDHSLRGYQLASALALGGVALSMALTAGLAGTVRRQAAERDRLQAELRRSERLAALGKLLAGVAHEVRNPLAGIRSTVQLWQRGIGPDAESYDDLLAEADRLEGLVARLLHFSRADAQELVPGDLNAVVGEVARLAAAQAAAQRVEVRMTLDPTLPTLPIAAPAIVQVLRNLTTNALQAMPAGGTLLLTTRFDSRRRQAEVSVADTGPGLAPEALAHLFEPFFTTKASGTGLGLAIAREIALAHRGELRGEPRPDGLLGAVFLLTLPVTREPETSPRRDAGHVRA